MSSESPRPKGTERVSRRRVLTDGVLRPPSDDHVTVEQPLEIRIGGESFVTTMRTPGDDHRLTLGFLFAEGLIESVSDVSTVVHCGKPMDAGFGNLVEVTPGPGFFFNLDKVDASRRGTLVTASCGVCGRQRIDDLMNRIGTVRSVARVPTAVLLGAPDQLRPTQKIFALTGAVHGAAVLDVAGHALAFAEDVGRHNAVDKVVGRLLVERRLSRREGQHLIPPAPSVLVVSGRTSFEIVQKAAAAGLAVVAGVGGTTSMAIDLARAAGITLCGFVGDSGLSVYSHPHRLAD